MPGINLAIRAPAVPGMSRADLERIQDTMRHDASYHSNVLLAQDGFFLGATGYKEYPIATFERRDYFILLEGLVYNKSLKQVEEELGDLAAHLGAGSDAAGRVRSWVLGSFGDYVVLVLDRTQQRLFFFNDALARLPLFCLQGDGLFALSREIKFLAAIQPSVACDRQAIAECILLNCVLGPRTLVEGVSKVEAATLGSVDLARAQAEQSVFHMINLDEYPHADKPLEQLAGELTELFVGACQDISASCSHLRQVVSLSGGLDSRAVAAGMKQVTSQLSAATFHDLSGVDAALAGQVAKALEIPWQLFELEPYSVSHAERIARLKDGRNAIGGFLGFFDQLRDLYGSGVACYSGDGSNWILKKLSTPYHKPRNLDMLVDGIVGRATQITLDQVGSLTGQAGDDIRDAIAKRVGEYPEQNWTHRYLHFILYEMGFRWLFEGEDRNRFFFWSAAPFSYLPVLDYGLKIPNARKGRYRLYERFMAKLCPACMGLVYSRWGAPFASPRRYLHDYAFALWENMPPASRTWINNVRRGQKRKVQPAFRDYMLQSIDQHPTVARHLSGVELAAILDRGCSQSKVETLLTLVAYLRQDHRPQLAPARQGGGPA